MIVLIVLIVPQAVNNKCYDIHYANFHRGQTVLDAIAVIMNATTR